ncbi:uncharacterized protein K460DRAFT_93333 [Cucurbitaria berberidis CBS 394.84]|uniref:Uncharacterized protein n=1 Tax=Cucurbitaria berberidis CBS 394.84 TaxID=1168544 RepID=A0A9P4GFX5_9PLEO|nr:uncharacterized protein K460DRAFT_93333 [Cucurbitaria berberidis CBS 394.84]KAF1844526.1 hypothetical protein K460DRAFT_93333 [Cucurbitaria berberidis CBS 394.84]
MKTHRDHVIRTFEALAYLAKRFDPDGIGLFFTNHREEGHGRDRDKLVQLLKKVDFSGQCSMDIMLTSILEQSSESRLSTRIRRAVGIKKWRVSSYVLTNGIWNNPYDSGAGDIPQLIKRTVERMDGRAKLGTQFIQFGSDPIGIE